MDQDWWQQALIPQEVIEVTLRFGVVASSNHVQWAIEAKDPTTGVLLGQVSNPHGAFTDFARHLDEAAARFKIEAHALVNPF